MIQLEPEPFKNRWKCTFFSPHTQSTWPEQSSVVTRRQQRFELEEYLWCVYETVILINMKPWTLSNFYFNVFIKWNEDSNEKHSQTCFETVLQWILFLSSIIYFNQQNFISYYTVLAGSEPIIPTMHSGPIWRQWSPPPVLKLRYKASIGTIWKPSWDPRNFLEVCFITIVFFILELWHLTQ